MLALRDRRFQAPANRQPQSDSGAALSSRTAPPAVGLGQTEPKRTADRPFFSQGAGDAKKPVGRRNYTVPENGGQPQRRLRREPLKGPDPQWYHRKAFARVVRNPQARIESNRRPRRVCFPGACQEAGAAPSRIRRPGGPSAAVCAVVRSKALFAAPRSSRQKSPSWEGLRLRKVRGSLRCRSPYRARLDPAGSLGLRNANGGL